MFKHAIYTVLFSYIQILFWYNHVWGLNAANLSALINPSEEFL